MPPPLFSRTRRSSLSSRASGPHKKRSKSVAFSAHDTVIELSSISSNPTDSRRSTRRPSRASIPPSWTSSKSKPPPLLRRSRTSATTPRTDEHAFDQPPVQGKLRHERNTSSGTGEGRRRLHRRGSSACPSSEERLEDWILPVSPKSVQAKHKCSHSALVASVSAPIPRYADAFSRPYHLSSPRIAAPTIRKLRPALDDIHQGKVGAAYSSPSFHVSCPSHYPTYVVRQLFFGGTQFSCMTMLDASHDRHLPSTVNQPPSFKPHNLTVRPSPGKGLGLFSQATVYIGEVLLAEHPILVLPYTLGTNVPQTEVYNDMLSHLSPDQLRELVSITDPQSSGARGQPNISARAVISRITSFAIPFSDHRSLGVNTDMHRGVFLRMSRCNHSCGPNAQWYWDSASFALVLVAVRQIDPGEEVTIAYTDVTLPRQERRLNLLNSFGFECQCHWCALSRLSISDSDAARHFLSTFWDSASRPTFETWCSDPTSPTNRLIADHQQALNYIASEGLESLTSVPRSTRVNTSDVIRHVDAIAMCYAALRDADKFSIWISKAAEAREQVHCLPADHKLVFHKWRCNPTTFPMWGAKKAAEFRR